MRWIRARRPADRSESVAVGSFVAGATEPPPASGVSFAVGSEAIAGGRRGGRVGRIQDALRAPGLERVSEDQGEHGDDEDRDTDACRHALGPQEANGLESRCRGDRLGRCGRGGGGPGPDGLDRGHRGGHRQVLRQQRDATTGVVAARTSAAGTASATATGPRRDG